MTSSIPISNEVKVIPGVAGTGGNPLALNAVVLTKNAMQPQTALLPFYNSDDVGTYFGTTSDEYKIASIYFAGFVNCTAFPNTLYFAGYSDSATSAWLRGSSLVGQPLSYYQAISGTLGITVDGTAYSASALNLASATSIGGAENSSVINLIKTALSWSGANKPVITWDSLKSEFVITAHGTGTTSTIDYATGTTAASLGLTAGILSQGAIASVPADKMIQIENLSTDWATFFTAWEPTNAEAIAFGQWTATKNDRYLYIAWDSDPTAKTPSNASSLGAILAADEFDGVITLWASTGAVFIAAAAAGYAAALNWNTLNGRATLKFRQFEGLASYTTPVTSQADAIALIGNGYTYFGTYTAPGIGNSYNIFADGALAGSRFKWVDTYLGQIFLNSQLALSIFEGLLQVNLAPYNEVGNTLIRAWCADPIAQAVNAGIIREGVTLSNSQKAAITYAVGKDISNELQTRGYYLFIGTATAQVRGQRQSPPLMLYYMDGGAIQKVTLNSIVVL